VAQQPCSPELWLPHPSREHVPHLEHCTRVPGLPGLWGRLDQLILDRQPRGRLEKGVHARSVGVEHGPCLLIHGDIIHLGDVVIETKKTNPPPRYSEGSLIDAMENAWKFVENDELKMRLKQAKGIGTPATRAEIIKGLMIQNLIQKEGLELLPTTAGMKLYRVLKGVAPELVNPAVTAMWELHLDAVVLGRRQATTVVDGISADVHRLITLLKSQKERVTIDINAAGDCRYEYCDI